MQSDGDYFCGDVVLGSFNMSYSDEDSILEQKFKSKYLEIFIMKTLYFKSDWWKCIFKEMQHITTRSLTIGF